MIIPEPKIVSRDCEAIQIPTGDRITIRTGTGVRITQSLGGTYTVLTDEGFLARVAEKDADALGLGVATSVDSTASAPAPSEPLEKLVWDQLKTCFDPEIPVNIVELGLVYQCRVTPLDEGGHKADVQFTLTAPGCGMGNVLKDDIERKILGVPGIRQAQIEVIFDPPWNPSRMSDAAKLQLGML